MEASGWCLALFRRSCLSWSSTMPRHVLVVQSAMSGSSRHLCAHAQYQALPKRFVFIWRETELDSLKHRMSRRSSTKTISGPKDAAENVTASRKPTGRGKRKPKKGSKEKLTMPLAPLQPHFNEPSVLVGGSKTPKRQQQISFTKKTDRIARSMSPLLPEIPVTVNKEGVFEIERVPQETTATQTEPMKTVEKGTQTEDLPASAQEPEESVDYQLCSNDPPPSVYWEVMAEKRRVALKETIDENERLWQEIEALREEVKEGERQRNNALYFQFMYRLVAEETKNLL